MRLTFVMLHGNRFLQIAKGFLIGQIERTAFVIGKDPWENGILH